MELSYEDHICLKNLVFSSETQTHSMILKSLLNIFMQKKTTTHTWKYKWNLQLFNLDIAGVLVSIISASISSLLACKMSY